MFNQATIEALGYYVYSLTDPRTNKVFYIGKGCGQRIFMHVQDALKDSRKSDKLDLIREIHGLGLEVDHCVLRHGMTEEAAFEVEAFAIDCRPELTNKVKGHGMYRGPQSAQEIDIRYGAEEADLYGVKVMIIKINKSFGKLNTWDATRFSWVVNPIIAMNADIVLGVANGIIRGVYVPEKWVKSVEEEEPEMFTYHKVTQKSQENRKVLVGHEAPAEMQERFLNKQIPAKYSMKGSMNSFRYNF